MDIKKFHQQVSKNWSKNLKCFVNSKDAQAGKEFIDNAENGKFDEKVKNAELEEKNRLLQDEIRRLKGEKKKPVIKPKNTKDLNPTPKKPHKKRSKK